MPLNLILILAALLVSWLVFRWMFKVVKTTFTTALAIATIILVLQLTLGIGPNRVLEQIIDLPQILWHLIHPEDTEPNQTHTPFNPIL